VGSLDLELSCHMFWFLYWSFFVCVLHSGVDVIDVFCQGVSRLW
jgi:hypothetical protein